MRFAGHSGACGRGKGCDMALTVDLYQDRTSWLHSTDPRAKLALMGLFIVIVLSAQNLPMLLTLVSGVMLVHRSIGTPRHRIARLLRALLPISLLMPVVWMIFYPAGDLAVWIGTLRLPLVSLLRGTAVVLRIHAVTFSVLALLYTTDQASLVRGLEKLGLPYRWGLVLSLAFRYIPALQLTFESILQAQQARGMEFESRRGVGRVRALMPVFIPTVITILRDSERMGNALEARGFAAHGVRRSSYKDVKFRSTDWAYLVVALSATAILLFLEVSYGLGSNPLRLMP